MNQYANQIYFNMLCDEYHIIHNEFMRIVSHEDQKAEGYAEEYNTWSDRLNSIKERIFDYLIKLKMKNKTLIFNKKEQTEIFIRFFTSTSFEGHKIINLDDEFKDHFPDDEISQKFIKAYENENIDQLLELYRMLF